MKNDRKVIMVIDRDEAQAMVTACEASIARIQVIGELFPEMKAALVREHSLIVSLRARFNQQLDK